MNKKVKFGGVDLTSKKDLLLHTYDSFLTSQTRLFTLAHYSYQRPDSEIETKQNLLFLDDLLSFSITARRLIELTKLRSFSNHRYVGRYYLDEREVPATIVRLKDKQIGFLTFINCIIHCHYVELITNRFDFPRPPIRSEKDLFHYVELSGRISAEGRWNEYAISPSIAVVPDKHEPFLVVLKDVVSVSCEVTEKIIEVCSDSKIFLELDYRGA